MSEKRKTADELQYALKEAIDRYVDAKCWLERAQKNELEMKNKLGMAMFDVQARMLEAKPTDTSTIPTKESNG